MTEQSKIRLMHCLKIISGENRRARYEVMGRRKIEEIVSEVGSLKNLDQINNEMYYGLNINYD